MNFDCTNCEASFEIKATDHLIESKEPTIRYCPDCGKETLVDA